MLKRNLFFIFSILIVSAASLMLCIFNYNPYEANTNQFTIFYSSVLLFLASLFSITIFYLKISLSKKEMVYSYFWPSTRQGFILSAGIVTLLVLRGLRLLDVWTGAPLFMAIILIELFFQTKKRSA
ncbi:MAG: hypothetical protein BWY19_00542 [bacterium ADurb.Bin212]|nr:MAG: hypothetical protein BWY19_00542 [bacterium ADurb.Bin212]